MGFGGVLTDTLGRVITRSGLGSVLPDWCKDLCCGGPRYLRFNLCGGGETQLWVLSTLLNVNSSSIGYLGDCYCFSGEIRRQNELPVGATVVSSGGIESFENCCQCSEFSDTRCVYNEASDCCCSNLSFLGVGEDRYIVNGTGTYVEVNSSTGITYTITTTISDNHVTRVFTETGVDPYTEEVDLDATNAPSNYCGPENMATFIRALAADYPFYIAVGAASIVSATCDTATFSFNDTYSPPSNPATTITVDVAFSVQLKRPYTCGCSSIPDNGAMMLADDPMAFLPG